MKRFAYKTALLFSASMLFCLALPISTLADGGTADHEITQTVNGYHVSLIFENPAFVGENPVHVLVKDTMYMPVTGADLEIGVVEAHADPTEAEPTAEAKAMTGMGGMNAQPTAEAKAMTGMGGMDAQPTAEAKAMTGMGGMDAQPTAEAKAMTGMGGMEDVQTDQSHDQMGMVALSAGPDSGEYHGEVTIESDGDLMVRVHLTVADVLTEVDFPVHVARSNAGAIILGSFFAVNVALIAAAVVMKPKPLSIDLSKKA